MKLKKLWQILDGRKRYIGLTIMFIGGGLQSAGFIDEELRNTIVAFGVTIASFGFGAFFQKRIK